MFNSMNFQPVGYSLSASVIPDERPLSCRELAWLCLFFTTSTVLVVKCDWFLYRKGKITAASGE